MANAPALDNTNWKTWMAYVAANDTVPDRCSWHQIGSWEREPDRCVAEFDTLRAQYDLPIRSIDLNEYAWPSEQNPANSVFYIAQLERHDLRGLRANWEDGDDLHDFMADLLFKNLTYSPNGDRQVYKYYTSMTGTRVSTVASDDYQFDAFATIDGNNTVKVLAGTRTVQAEYDLSITGVSSLGLASEGTVSVQQYRFDWGGKTVDVGTPVDLGVVSMSYSNDTVSSPPQVLGSPRSC